MINLSSYQSAIYEELVKLGYEVYDEVTENAKFPYIVIGDVEFIILHLPFYYFL